MLSSRSRRQMPYWHAMVPVGLQVSRSSMNLVLTTYRETDVLATCRFHFSVPPRFDSCFLSHSVDASFRARDLGAWCDVFGAPIGVSLSLSLYPYSRQSLPTIECRPLPEKHVRSLANNTPFKLHNFLSLHARQDKILMTPLSKCQPLERLESNKHQGSARLRDWLIQQTSPFSNFFQTSTGLQRL